MNEQKLRQLFKNRANCYADADDVIQAMDEDCFIETVNEALRIHDVVGRSEQLFAFLEYCDNAGWIKNIDKKRIIDDYEKANNCV